MTTAPTSLSRVSKLESTCGKFEHRALKISRHVAMIRLYGVTLHTPINRSSFAAPFIPGHMPVKDFLTTDNMIPLLSSVLKATTLSDCRSSVTDSLEQTIMQDRDRCERTNVMRVLKGLLNMSLCSCSILDRLWKPCRCTHPLIPCCDLPSILINVPRFDAQHPSIIRFCKRAGSETFELFEQGTSNIDHINIQPRKYATIDTRTECPDISFCT